MTSDSHQPIARSSDRQVGDRLEPEDAARLAEFARACKAAARAIALYPPAHPAIATSLGHIVRITSTANLVSPLRITVLPDSLMLDGRSPLRPDQAVTELATLLHDHLVGELTVHPGGDVEAWRTVLTLIGRPVDSVRADGGISRLWPAEGGAHVEVREIDYAEVLRERSGGEGAVWERVIANCLDGDRFDLDEEAINALVEIAGDPQRFSTLLTMLEARASTSGGVPAQAAALIRILRGIADFVARSAPDRMEPILRNMAGAIGQLSPDVLLELLSQPAGGGVTASNPRLVGEVVRRMSDSTVSRFLARNIVQGGTSTDRLAEAFHALVPDEEQRYRLVSLARDEVATTPLGKSAGFESLWNDVSQLLTSYSDSAIVSDAYGRELSGARSQAIEVERISDDPPDRVSAWLASVAASSVRTLDLLLLLDLLRIEEDPASWRELMRPVTGQIEDLLLVGDFEAAEQLVAVLAREAGPGGLAPRKPSASRALEQLGTGSLMRHIVSHLATIDDAQFEQVKSLSLTIGEMLVRPLAEMLSTEERGRTRERLTALLIAFGATGRQTVERLRSSPNPAVRRTAVYLLREFGGTEALPDLALLLDDAEPQVQREAVRAILSIGTDGAYRVLEQALASGTPQSREAIMQAIGLVRDGRATPLFVYILRHVDHRGPLAGVYLRAIESLGALRDGEAVAPLKDVLYRGEWWAPRRTAQLRAAAATALGKIATPEALAVLREAAAGGSRQIRAAARQRLEGR